MLFPCLVRRCLLTSLLANTQWAAMVSMVLSNRIPYLCRRISLMKPSVDQNWKIR